MIFFTSSRCITQFAIALLTFTWIVAAARPSALQILDFASTSAIDTTPRFAWSNNFNLIFTSQTAYQIIVKEGSSTIWDSKIVRSGSHSGIVYKGPALKPASTYSWQVRSWSNWGENSGLSIATPFWTGFFSSDQWNKGTKWIAAPQTRVGLTTASWIAANNTIKKTFSITNTTNIKSALTSITGTTPFILFVNGAIATNSTTIWSKNVTDIDIVDYLKSGSNSIEISTTAGAAGVILRSEIRTQDNQFTLIATDSSWTSNNGPATVVAPYWSAPWATWQILKFGGSVVDAPQSLRREFPVTSKVASATLYISGLGQFQAFVNGQKIGGALDQSWSDYSFRTTYTTFDVTSLLRAGENALGVQLGNGWWDYQTKSVSRRWGMGEAGIQYIKNYGIMRLWAQLKIVYKDGSVQTISSDNKWKTSPSPWVFTGVYGSETYDFRMEQQNWATAGFDDSKWSTANTIDAPPGIFQSQRNSPVTTQDSFTAAVLTTAPSYAIYDLGTNINGQVEITTTTSSVVTYNIIPGERITNGRVFPVGNGKNTTNNYITYSKVITSGSGKPETFRQSFSTAGFRYIEIQQVGTDPLPQVNSVIGHWTYSDAPVMGTFKSSNESYNQVYKMVDQTLLNNFISIHTDCPQYEKLGWQEVVANLARSYSFIRNIQPWMSNILDIVRDDQISDGMIPSIAPSYTAGVGQYNDDPLWGRSIMLAPVMAYNAYGDLQIIKDNYPAAQAYYKYLMTKAVNGLVQYGLGDWVSPAGQQIPNTEAASVVYAATLMAQMADILGKSSDAAAYRADFDKNAATYNTAFFNTSSCSYSPPVQANQAMPLAYNITPSAQSQCANDALIDIIKNPYNAGPGIKFGPIISNHITAGEHGLLPVVTALSQINRDDLIETMFFQPDQPSFWSLILNNQTTLPEQWNFASARSLNHDMFATVMEWFYTNIGGISELTPGWATFKIQPRFGLSMEEADVTFQSPHGIIGSSWKKSGKTISWTVKIPSDTKAQLWFPGASRASVILAALSGRSEKIAVVKTHWGTWTTVWLGSGTWKFKFPLS